MQAYFEEQRMIATAANRALHGPVEGLFADHAKRLRWDHRNNPHLGLQRERVMKEVNRDYSGVRCRGC